MVTQELIGDEDCLYLNVFTTDIKPRKKRTVMVWIHAGGFFTGTGDDCFYGPDYIVNKEVVLITLNYRLGALGMMFTVRLFKCIVNSALFAVSCSCVSTRASSLFPLAKLFRSPIYTIFLFYYFWGSSPHLFPNSNNPHDNNSKDHRKRETFLSRI